MTTRIRILTRKNNLSFNRRLRVVPHFSEGIVERAKRKRAWKITPREKRRHFFLSPRRVSPFLAWVDFHARSRFVRSTIPEEKWGTTRSLIQSRIDKWAKMVSSGIILPFFWRFYGPWPTSRYPDLTVGWKGKFIKWLNPRILRSDWLPEQARWDFLARSGFPALVPQEKSSLFRRIINSLLTKFVRSGWLDTGLVLFYAFIDLNLVSRQKRTWPVYRHLDLTLGK